MCEWRDEDMDDEPIDLDNMEFEPTSSDMSDEPDLDDDDYSLSVSGPSKLSAKKFDVVDGVLRKYNGNEAHVVIPDGVTKIGDGAFEGCASMNSLAISNSVTDLGEGAFSDCKNLESVSFPKSSVSIIPSSCFSGCEKLTSVKLPDSLTEIWAGAFENCVSLSSIDIPRGVKEMASYVFSGCTSLTHITVPSGVTALEPNVFCGCTSLSDISIPDSVTVIEEETFSDCKNLRSISVPDTVTEIGDGAFRGCGLTSICVPSSVTELKNGIFEGCSKLHYVLIPDSVKKIGDSVFKDCHNLSLVTNDPVEFKDRCGFFSDPNREILISVVVPNSVISIGKSAFEGCSNLETVIISDSVTEIGDSAFSGCRGLKRVAIPNSVKRIGCEAFSGSALYHVTIPAAAVVESRVFDRCQELSKATIHVESTQLSADSFPNTLKSVKLCFSSSTKKVKDMLNHLIDETFSQCDISVIETDKDGFKVKDGVLVKYYGSKYDVVIPDSVKVIQKDAFVDCLRLVSVTIPASVVEIDKKTFDCRPKPRIIRYY